MALTLPLIVRALALAVTALAGASLNPQTVSSNQATSHAAAAKKIAAVKSFRVIHEEDGPAVEILSTRPLVPQIHLLKEPTRLVIDLPQARIDMAEKRIEIQADQIGALRANQFQESPPVARVVVDLLAARSYKWEALGNRLVVHLGKNPAESQSPFETASVPSLTRAPQPVVKAVRAAGPLALASNAGSVGTSFRAGADTAVLSLSSGGELHVCQGTMVSIIPSANRHNLLLGMNTGTIEAHLQLDASTDLLMTPDFRITLEGPGEFHYAFSSDNRGDTCVRALPGNTAAATATELLGDRTYQIKATDQLVFRGGRLDRVDVNVPLECGCAPPRQNIDRAANEVPAQVAIASEARSPANADSQTTDGGALPASVPTSGVPAAASESAPQSEMHVQVSTPLVFRASGSPPAPVEDVGATPVEQAAPAKSSAPPPVTAPATERGLTVQLEPERRGFFRRIGGWFARILR